MWKPKTKSAKLLGEYLKTEFLKDPTYENIKKLGAEVGIDFRSVYRYLRSMGLVSPVKSHRKLVVDKSVNT